MRQPPPSHDYAVVIPAFNAARTLGNAIASALAQTVPPATVVVVDDGSTDATADIARSFGNKVLLVQQTNFGPAAATDRGFASVDAELIAGLDADDLWLPDKAGRQLARLALQVDVDAIFCRAANFQHGTAFDPSASARDLWGRSAMMIRRSRAARIGPMLDPANPRGLGEMIRWLDRGRQLGLAFEMMPDVLVGRRIIDGSLSFARDPAGLLPMLRAKLARRV